MRESWMDAMRGIAMLLVVLFHAGTGVAYFGDFYPRGIDVFNQVVEPYRMPALMFLSGMLLHRSLSKSASLYFGGKARKIAWPYVLWSLIGLMLAGDVTFAYIAQIAYNPAETHLWYLWFLLIFYVIAWLLKSMPAWIPALLALVVSHFLPEAFRMEKGAFLFAFFMLGHWYAQYRSVVDVWMRRPFVWIIAVASAATSSWFNVVGFKVVYEPIFVLGVIGSIYLAMRLVPLIPAGKPRQFLEYLGVNSIVLYIVHLFAIRVAGTLLAMVDVTDPYVQYPIFVIFGLGSGMLLMRIITRQPWLNGLFVWPFSRRVSAV
uniref:acyltransferase family protein n=1 Tax=Pseudoclavibacter sp. RFBI5 TaxID=2080578 RepID=UPI0015E371CD|nr:acyltransferase family protein [Pseudoclavibacter sp. RFBI5]